MKNRNAKEATILFPSKAPTDNTPMPVCPQLYSLKRVVIPTFLLLTNHP